MCYPIPAAESAHNQVATTVFLGSSNHPKFTHMLQCFAKGINATGDIVSVVCGAYEPCDVAVIFGSCKNKPDTHHVLKRDIIRRAKHFIVCEAPLLGRGPVKDVLDDQWYRVGVNGFLADSGNFNNRMKPGDRWEKIQQALGVHMKPWNTRGRYILVALQIADDASLRGSDISQWAYNVVHTVRNHSTRPIIVRTPQYRRTFNFALLNRLTTEVSDVRFQFGTKDNLIPTLNECWCTVTYSSGLGIDSIVNGVPSFATDTGSFVYCLGNTDVRYIETPKYADRVQWVYDLSYAQWNIDEIESGEVWRHLRPLF